jgi:integrase
LCYFCDVKANATESSSGVSAAGSSTVPRRGSTRHQFHAPTFAKVLDGRKQPIRGLWVRNGRFYAQLAIEDGATGQKSVRRVPLLDKDRNAVQSAAQAVEAFNRLKVNRSDSNLPVLRRTPKFSEYVKIYLTFIKAGQESGQAMKKPATIVKEEGTLKHWVEELGGTRLDRISLRHINAHIAKRLEAGRNKRTVKLDIIPLNNLLNHALDEGLIHTVPKLSKEGRKRLKSEPAPRPLFTAQDLEVLCTAAMSEKEDGTPVTKNWLQFCDFIRLLAYCGAREQEALRLRWSDVDFEREQLSIGSDGDTKSKTGRKVDFNPKLKAHLESMRKRRAPDSQWLFPSPQRGEKDLRAQTFRESLKLVRAHAAKHAPHLARRAFHDLRHCFASYCVMSGIDFKTVSQWLGHRDGGFLVCKVYSHLSDAHKREQAQRVNFGPTIVEAAG